ncbi:MAG: TlpA disulfide reductase family protein [Cyclobacteriaceae bacterium]
MRIIGLFFLIASLIPACSTPGSQGGITVSGKVNKLNPGVKIYLEELTDNSFKKVDTAQIDGNLEFAFNLGIPEPSFYRINFAEKQFVNVILNNTDVFVTADGDKPIGFSEVKGSPDTDYFYEVSKMQENYQQGVRAANAQFAQARSKGDIQQAMQAQQSGLTLQENFEKELKKKIWEMGPSITALFALNYLGSAENHYSFMDSLAQRFQAELPDSKYTRQLTVTVGQMSKLTIGSIAPEITLPTPEGDEISLSSLRGQHVLIDFWAGWCKPCRIENPNVLRAYNKYHDKGFEIFGVSLDRTRQQWLSAIEQDGLIWEHGSDLAYFRSQAAEDYQITAIPATYLIDPEGRIIAKNLRGPSLDAKLSELFD